VKCKLASDDVCKQREILIFVGAMKMMKYRHSACAQRKSGLGMCRRLRPWGLGSERW
jgi:hypothetical protein